jgi:hypothetical protein
MSKVVSSSIFYGSQNVLLAKGGTTRKKMFSKSELIYDLPTGVWCCFESLKLFQSTNKFMTLCFRETIFSLPEFK